MREEYNPIRDLVEWHTKFGVPVVDRPTIAPSNRAKLRVELIREEFNELIDAIALRSLPDIADAIGDLLYVVYGTGVEFGIPIAPVFNEVHRSNMSKVWADGTVHRREDGKILKPPTYSPAQVDVVLSEYYDGGANE